VYVIRVEMDVARTVLWHALCGIMNGTGWIRQISNSVQKGIAYSCGHQKAC